MLEIVTISGAILGILAFVWNVRDAIVRYLHISLEVSNDGEWALAKAGVENNGVLLKRIANALLLVGPEFESPVDCFNRLSRDAGLDRHVTTTNEIAAIGLNAPVFRDRRALIPLPFFYSENIAVGDERLSYCAPIDLRNFVADEVYSVRFFVVGNWRLHRSTHAAFVKAR